VPKQQLGPVAAEERGPLLEGLGLTILRAHNGDSELFEEVSYWATAQARQTEVDFLFAARSRVSRRRSQSAAAILDAAIGGTAGDRRTAAAHTTNPRVPRGASVENGRRDRCLAARSFDGGRSRWFTLALSDIVLSI
jgi:hypothetical protein